MFPTNDEQAKTRLVGEQTRQTLRNGTSSLFFSFWDSMWFCTQHRLRSGWWTALKTFLQSIGNVQDSSSCGVRWNKNLRWMANSRFCRQYMSNSYTSSLLRQSTSSTISIWRRTTMSHAMWWNLITLPLSSEAMATVPSSTTSTMISLTGPKMSYIGLRNWLCLVASRP